MAGIGPLSQDWEPVIIRKKAPNAATKKDEKVVNAARRSGADIETVKKSNAGTNKAASSSTSLNTRELDEGTENLSRMEGLVSNVDGAQADNAAGVVGPPNRVHCVHCNNRTFNSRAALSFHYDRVHGRRYKFECGACGNRFLREAERDGHKLEPQ